MANVFANTSNVDAPASGGFAITPSNSALLANETRGILVGGSGNIAVEFVDGSTVTLIGVVAGSLLPVRVRKVLSTGTTATNLVGLY